MNPDQFRREIAKGKAAPAYLFSGSETRLKREALDALAAIVPEGQRAFNVQVFHAFESEMVDVVTAARTQPFFGKRRIVVLRDIEKTRLDQAGRGELLADYLAAPSPETVFVVTTEDDAKAKALGKQFGAAWTVVLFNPLKGEALAGAVRREAARLGCAIDAAAVTELIEVAGDEQAQVFSELAKLRLAVGEGGTIDGAAVARYTAGYVHHRDLDIVDAISRRDLPASLQLIGEVAIDDQEFLRLLGMLGKQLRALWFLAGGAREVPKEFRMYGSQVDKVRADARRFTREEIERGLQGLALLDDRVKSTAVAPKLLLEHFLLGFLPVR
jgi:DNA polymerase III delta subunit